jgi:hypothetical protein
MYLTGEMSPAVFKVGNEIKAVLMPVNTNKEFTKLEKASALLLSELQKAKAMPIGTVNKHGYKKVAEGKWVKEPGAARGKEQTGGNIDTKSKSVTTGTAKKKVVEGERESEKETLKPGKKQPGDKPEPKPGEKPEAGKGEKKGLTDVNKNTIKNTLKKVASILADALSGRDSVTPTGQAVEQAGDTISGKGKKKKLETTRPGAQPPDKKPEKK